MALLMANNQNARRERIDWVVEQLTLYDPGLPLYKVRTLLAGKYMLSKPTIDSDIDALLGQSGISNRNGLICVNRGA